jgi:predicted DNA binding CopG/RHH family protein
MRKQIKLDNQEKKIEKALKKGEYLRVANLVRAKKLFIEAARNYKEMGQTKRITIRVKNEDLIRVKANAKRNNIPYQTLLNALIRQYTQNRIPVKL